MAEIQQALLEMMAEHAVNDFLAKKGKKLQITRSCITHVELAEITEPGWRLHRPNSTKGLIDPVWWPSGTRFELHFVVPRGRRTTLKTTWWVPRSGTDLGGRCL